MNVNSKSISHTFNSALALYLYLSLIHIFGLALGGQGTAEVLFDHCGRARNAVAQIVCKVGVYGGDEQLVGEVAVRAEGVSLLSVFSSCKFQNQHPQTIHSGNRRRRTRTYQVHP